MWAMMRLGLVLAVVGGCACSESRQRDAGPPGAHDGGPEDRDGGAVEVCVRTEGACPSYLVQRTHAACTFSTDDGSNLVEDSRLEFGDAPEHALLFAAPTAGRYSLRLTAEPSTNGSCGVTAFDSARNLHQPSDCPSPGRPVDLDGLFATESDVIELTAGHEVLIFAGCAEFASPDRGEFVLEVHAE